MTNLPPLSRRFLLAAAALALAPAMAWAQSWPTAKPIRIVVAYPAGQGTDIAMKSADIIIVRDDLRTVVDAVALSRKTIRTIRINLVWAFGYNIAAIPIAAAGLLNPLIAAAAMAMSSVLVVSNSLRLRTYEPVE